MQQLSFHVAEYEAPLDLILHLISKNKLDIMDIDISSLLDQYMEIIEKWQQMNLDIASEFLEMASRLVYMKTASLLPRNKEESDRLRGELSGQLMEYKICKLAAEKLDKQNQYSDIFIRRPMDIDIDPTYKQQHDSMELYLALVDAMGREIRRQPPSSDTFEPIVARPIVSVTSKIFTVLRLLRQEDQLALDNLFDPNLGRSGLVATFLAVLELIKSGRVKLDENMLFLPEAA